MSIFFTTVEKPIGHIVTKPSLVSRSLQEYDKIHLLTSCQRNLFDPTVQEKPGWPHTEADFPGAKPYSPNSTLSQASNLVIDHPTLSLRAPGKSTHLITITMSKHNISGHHPTILLLQPESSCAFDTAPIFYVPCSS